MAIKLNADLVNDVARRRFVLFVGAGASRWAMPKTGERFKDWVEFLTTATKKLGKNTAARRDALELIKGRDFLLAAELLKRKLRDEWVELLNQEFQRVADVSKLHAAIVSLDPRIIVTTNFDKLLETAWPSDLGGRGVKVITKLDRAAFGLFRDDQPYLIKLHGTIDAPVDVIFDAASYRARAFDDYYYPSMLRTLLLTHTVIFIGFSMADPAVVSLVEECASRFSGARPHYILTAARPCRELADMSRELRNLYVLSYSDENSHAQLAVLLEELAGQALLRRRELAVSLALDSPIRQG